MTTGWAVKQNGQILVATVSPTARAAVVNWLVVAAKVPVMNHNTDKEIETMFVQYGERAGAELVGVEITEKTDD